MCKLLRCLRRVICKINTVEIVFIFAQSINRPSTKLLSSSKLFKQELSMHFNDWLCALMSNLPIYLLCHGIFCINNMHRTMRELQQRAKWMDFELCLSQGKTKITVDDYCKQHLLMLTFSVIHCTINCFCEIKVNLKYACWHLGTSRTLKTETYWCRHIW